MITLQQTAGDNNETIWCLRLRGEGTNLVTLGDFSADTGWTMTGDWAIGSGVATYTYVDDATGALYRTLAAASAVSYILEYEVTAKSGAQWVLDAADLTVMGGGSYFFANGVRLDSSVGKHSIKLLGNAGGTELRFTITDNAATDTISIDNVNIRVSDNVLYLSTRDIKLDNTYDGQVLNQGNYLTDLNQNSSIASSGGTGSVSSFSLSISRYVNNAGFSSFFNNFYPTTNTGYLTSKIIDFGVCWVGATTDTEITWLFRGRVIDYNYEQRVLNLTIFQESEISNKEVPYYTVQKDFDNGVSYFLYAPQDSYNITIPIIYGDFTKGTVADGTDYGVYLGYTAIAPCIPISKRSTRFIVCSHKVYEASENQALFGSVEILFKYIDGLQAYLWIRNNVGTDSSTLNNDIRHYFSMTDRGSRLIGNLVIRLTDQSELSDIDDIDNAIDQEEDTYSVLTAVAGGDQRLALKCIGTSTTADVGYLGIADEDIFVYFRASTDGGGNRNFTVSYYNNAISTPAGDGSPTSGTLTSGTASDTASHYFGTDTGGKFKDGNGDATLPWTIEEVTGLDFYIENNQTTDGDDIFIYRAYVLLSNIKVFSINQARIARNSGNTAGGRGI